MSLKQQAEIKRLQRRADEVDDVISALWQRIEELENKEKKGPGRPKKVVNG